MSQFPKTLVHHRLPTVIARNPIEEEGFVLLGYGPVNIPEFSEFPITLIHPAFEPAREVSPASHNTAPGVSATARLYGYVPAVVAPEKYPAVVAHNAEQEKQYLAQGYRRGGTSDRETFNKVAAAKFRPQADPSEFCEHPKWLKSPDGEDVLAKTAAEERALRTSWSKSERKRA